MARKVKAHLTTSTDGNDWIEGGSGNDILTGGAGADKFVFRDGFGTDHITDFNAAAGDRVLFDIGGGYNDVMSLQQLGDGVVVPNGYGTAWFEVHAGDHNGDGITDTIIDAYDLSGLQGTVIIDSVAPETLWGWALMGG